MQHEIGNRTYIVADVEPLDVDGVRTVEVGTVRLADRLPGAAAVLRPARATPAAPGGCGPAWPGSGWGCSGWSTAAGGAGRAGAPRAPSAGLSGAAPSLAAEVSRLARSHLDHRARGSRLRRTRSRRVRVSKTRSGQRLGLVLLGQPHLGVRAAAVVEATPPGRRRWRRRWRRRRRCRLSGPAIRTRKPQLRAVVRRRLGDGRLGAAVAVVPALRGEVAALHGEGADPAEAEVLGDLRGSAPCRRCRAGRRRRSTSGPGAGPRRSTGSRSPGERSPGWIRSR